MLEICQRADLVFLGLHGMDGEDGRIQAALDLASAQDADYLGLRRAAALLAPWRKTALLDGAGMGELTLTARVEAKIQRSYHADG